MEDTTSSKKSVESQVFFEATEQTMTFVNTLISGHGYGMAEAASMGGSLRRLGKDRL